MNSRTPTNCATDVVEFDGPEPIGTLLMEVIERRNKALREMDLNYARKNIPQASSDEVLVIALHKARYECSDLEPELRHESGKWLRERGYGRVRGELLPEGELPE